MAEELSDNRLFTYLQRYIERNKLYGQKLKGLRFCGHTVLPEHNAVFVITNGEESRYSTLIRCHSTWACPYCMPRVMAKKGADIACAIDALATWYKQKAAMITFTLPHDKHMSCEDAYEILMLTWRMFNRNGRTVKHKRQYELKSDVDRVNKMADEEKYKYHHYKNKTDQRAVGKQGEKKTYECGYSPWADFRVSLKMDYWVRVYEFTYGDNGWHPHIHMLAWVPQENLQKTVEFEDAILDSWWHCAKYQALKYYKQKYPDQIELYTERVEKVYADYKKISKDGHRSVYISKDKHGKVIAQQSSHYVTGWSGNMELTGGSNMKHAQDGHLTPYQMLEMSCANAVEAERLMPLFIEYAQVTRGHRRVELSKHPPLNKIIEKWKMSEEYVQMIKKKCTETVGVPWRVVAWFNKEQWYDICEWDTTTDEDIRTTILQLARAPDPWQAIADYVDRFDIILNMHEHPKQKVFESHIYENERLAEAQEIA